VEERPVEGVGGGLGAAGEQVYQPNVHVLGALLAVKARLGILKKEKNGITLCMYTINHSIVKK
jgi:hypothetical protein